MSEVTIMPEQDTPEVTAETTAPAVWTFDADTLDAVVLYAQEKDASAPFERTALLNLATPLHDSIVAAITGDKAADSASHTSAQIQMAARVVCSYNGHPDFAGKTALYRRYLEVVEGNVWDGVDNDSKTRVRNRVQQMIRRTYMDAAIERHVRSAIDGMSDAPADLPAFKAAMAAEYTHAGLKVPEQYGGAQSPSGGPGQDNDSDAAATARAVDDFAAALEDERIPLYVKARGTHRAVSETVTAFVDTITGDTPEVTNRPEILERLGKIEALTRLALKVADGKADAGDLAAIKAAVWTPVKDDA